MPEQYIDDYDLHLKRGSTAEIEGYVHVQGAGAGQPVLVRIPQAGIMHRATTDASGNAQITIHAPGLELWAPEHPKLYPVEIQAGNSPGSDHLTDDIGFRTIEVRGTQILLNGVPIFLRGVSIHGEAPFRGGPAHQRKG